jgi:hypothetical protein
MVFVFQTMPCHILEDRNLKGQNEALIDKCLFRAALKPSVNSNHEF